MKNGEQKTKTALIFMVALAAVWFGLLVAPFVSGGLPEIIIGFPKAMENPFRISLCEDSLKTVLAFLGAYALCIVVLLLSQKNYRRGVEYGSAKWDAYYLLKELFYGHRRRKHYDPIQQDYRAVLPSFSR